jgi:hypothetical protein
LDFWDSVRFNSFPDLAKGFDLCSHGREERSPNIDAFFIRRDVALRGSGKI